MSRTRGYFDPIHKQVELEKYLWEIIDTPDFQRLRYLKQVGVNSYVYPSANHTRFEHSLGVCHLASQFMKILKRKHPRVVEDKDVVHIQIAALLHDVGHGPFSHLFERAMKRLGKIFDHEKKSVEIARRIISSVESKMELEFKIDLDLIEALIVGNDDFHYFQVKRFLNDIVHNSKSGLDVDKFDYLMRDSYMAGTYY
eukprot:NODE_6_length_70510_cov_1.054395.p45 type:complete len:198 gc:universal NODE_6_length_70510_cov_1.054395:6184-5591(-)